MKTEKRDTPIQMVINELKKSIPVITKDSPIYECGVVDGKRQAIDALLRCKSVEKIHIIEIRNMAILEGLTATTSTPLTGDEYYYENFTDHEN